MDDEDLSEGERELSWLDEFYESSREFIFENYLEALSDKEPSLFVLSKLLSVLTYSSSLDGEGVGTKVIFLEILGGLETLIVKGGRL